MIFRVYLTVSQYHLTGFFEYILQDPDRSLPGFLEYILQDPYRSLAGFLEYIFYRILIGSYRIFRVCLTGS